MNNFFSYIIWHVLIREKVEINEAAVIRKQKNAEGVVGNL